MLGARQLLGFRDKGELKATKFYLHKSKSKFMLLNLLLCKNTLNRSNLFILILGYKYFHKTLIFIVVVREDSHFPWFTVILLPALITSS